MFCVSAVVTPLILLKIAVATVTATLSGWLVSYIRSCLVQMPFGLETAVHCPHYCFTIVNPSRRILKRFFNVFRVITLHSLWTKLDRYDGIETPAIALKRAKLRNRFGLAVDEVAIARLRTCPWPISPRAIAHEFFAPWQTVGDGDEAASSGGGIAYRPPGWRAESFRQPSGGGAWV